jgi:biotin-(acetyl-CoA carboxylase) ligase
MRVAERVDGAPLELTLVGAVALADAVERWLGLTAQVRWPDAVLVNRKPVARAALAAGELAVELDLEALRRADGVAREAAALEPELAAALRQALAEWRAGGLDALYDRLGPRDFLRGRRVSVGGAAATALQVDRSGRLEVRLDGGGTRVLESGEVDYER